MKREEKKRKNVETIITLDDEGGAMIDEALRKLFERPVTGQVTINANKGKSRRVHLLETDAQN
ncbi:MAG: hypothetical protein QOC61_1288 [Acidobacteriota bacterium]|jgi:hypothetical protein|nr:hypothetical protein [Acidobacteriota bacterium]